MLMDHTHTHTHTHRRRGEVGFLSCVSLSFYCKSTGVPICCSTSKSQLSLSLSLFLSLSSSWVPQLQNPSSRFHLAGQAKQATPESQQTDQTRHHNTTQQDTHITPESPQQNKNRHQTTTTKPNQTTTRPQPYPTTPYQTQCLPTYLFTYLPTYLPIYLPTHHKRPSTHLIYLPIYLLTYPTKETFAPDHTRPSTFLILHYCTLPT